MNTIQKNVENIQKNIAAQCAKCRRNPKDITLLGVTKNRTLEEIQALIESGITCIGENKVQEAETKFTHISGEVEKHFIGHLQSNKINKALEIADCIHAVDSVHLAESISKRASVLKKTIPIFLEINTSDEPQKFGFTPKTVLDEFPELYRLENCTIQGLMTIAKQGTENEIRNCFTTLRTVRDKLTHTFGIPLKLSMGMTDDYLLAIEEGADILRIGRALFE